MAERTLRVALVEQFFGGSHRAWAEGYARYSTHDVRLFSLPPAHWKWRMQGGHVGIARALVEVSTADGPFDVVIASSMTDVAGLLGLGRRTLAATPMVFYVHENQLTYPRRSGEAEDLTYAMTNWTSMLAADAVVFNSEFHRSEWFSALPGFLRRLPDQRHDGLITEVEQRSFVLPVGIDLTALDLVDDDDAAVSGRPLVLWNQRWEYDKGPGAFAAAVERLLADGVDFEVAIAGERPGDAPPELSRLRRLLGDRLVHDGEADVVAYRRLLRRADVVVSTAHHEFFGVALTEAVAAGAFPVVPDRVVYPERIPPDLHPVCLYRDDDHFVSLLRRAILEPSVRRRVVDRLRPVMERFDWSEVAPRYDALIGALAAD